MKFNFPKLREVMRNPKIKPLEKCVLINLMLYAGSEGNPFPSQSTLARDLGFSSRHIRECLKILKKHGLLDSWKKRGYSKSNSYTINKELYFRIDETNRKSASPESGNTIPLQSGTHVPPKRKDEKNKLSISNNVLRLFERYAEKQAHGTDRRQLSILCEEYSERWVLDALDEAASRDENYTYITVKLITLILEDWKDFGKPRTMPKFKACNNSGCTKGYIYNNKTFVASKCNCIIRYEKDMSEWVSGSKEEFENK